MKHNLRTVFVTLLALLSVSLAHAQLNALEGWTNGFTMPMRITGSDKNTSVDIGIDNIRYSRSTTINVADSVVFDAHAKLQIPFAQGSPEIEFTGSYWRALSSNGVPSSGGELVGKIPSNLQRITIHENKLWMRLETAGIEFDCDGVKSINLTGAFIFAESFIQPANSGEQQVEATFNITVADWDALIFKVTFPKPFKVKGCGDFLFTVTDAVVDFSAQTNADDFEFPQGYDTGFLGGDETLWMGFALKKLTVTPPPEINELDGKETEACRFTFTAYDMLIDESGLTGSFMASRCYNSNSDNSSGLNVYIQTVGISIVQNNLVDGVIRGKVDVPLLSKKEEGEGSKLELALEGRIQYDRAAEKLRYRIDAEMLQDRDFSIPFTDAATITLSKGCSFTIGNDNEYKTFVATLLLNGMVNIKEGNGLNMEGIRFEDLKLSTHDPHITWTRFALVGTAGMDYGGFSINLTKLDLTNTPPDKPNKLTLAIGLNLALMDEQMSISAATGLTIEANYDQAGNRWKPQPAVLDSIRLDVDFSAFRFEGKIGFYREKEDNPTMYGNGFEGNITLKLKTLGFGAGAFIQFGRTQYNSPGQYYKYWNAQITTDVSDANIILFPPAVMLKSIKGGAYQRMRNTLYNQKKEGEEHLVINPNYNLNNSDYEPDKNVAFGFMAGIGLYYAHEKLISGKALLEMAFNSHCGLNYVSLQGAAAVLPNDPDDFDKDALFKAGLMSYYNVENKEFSAELSAKLNFFNVVKGQGYASIYSSPDTWFCHIGRMDNPNRLEFIGLIDVKSYFMFGAIPSQLPPLNQRMLSLFGPQTHSNAEGQEEIGLLGKGFAFGISLSADCGFGRKRGFLFAFVEVDGGTDALVNFKDDQCSRYTDWRAYGQAYAYVNGEFGVRVRRKKFRILQVSAAAVLNAQFPAPYHISGKVGFKFKVLFIKGQVRVRYSAGRSC